MAPLFYYYKTMIKRVGVFDSGIGGVSVLKELIQLPIAEFIYAGDTANLPYGEKTPEQITQFTTDAIGYLQLRGVTTVVIACHTASVIAYEVVRKEFPDLLILNVADPAVQAAVTATHNKRIGVIATPATIASRVHEQKILTLAPETTVVPMACPKLVPLIEAGASTQAISSALDEYLQPLIAQGIDTLIIGCTHYELIKELIAEKIGLIKIISTPELMKEKLAQLLPNPLPTTDEFSIDFDVSGDPAQFQANLNRLFGLDTDVLGVGNFGLANTERTSAALGHTTDDATP
jgi:glutamate racemase